MRWVLALGEPKDLLSRAYQAEAEYWSLEGWGSRRTYARGDRRISSRRICGVACSTEGDPILPVGWNFSRVAGIRGEFRRRPFPDIPDHVFKPPPVLSLWAGTDWGSGRFIEYGMILHPLIAPRVKVITLAVASCIFPFLFSRQPVGNAVALRTPLSKGIGIFNRDIGNG